MAKPLAWAHKNIKDTLQSPPMSGNARLEIGFLLRLLQEGESLTLPHSRPMNTIGSACHELRVSDGEQCWRVIYYLGETAVYILEVFNKKTQKTPTAVIEICRKRLGLIKLL